jgi:hypothetical protein
MTTITLNTESLFKDIIAAFDTMNRETPLNRFLVDLGRHQTLVLKEMIEGQLPHLMAEQSKEVKKLEEQNEKLYTTLKKLMEMRDECFIPNEGDWWDNMAQEAIALVEGENQ